MKIIKREGARPLHDYCTIMVLPMLIIFNVCIYFGFPSSNIAKLTLLIIQFTWSLVWYFVTYKIESKIFSRFICIMKQHPNRELLRVYNNRSDRKDDEIVLAEYHCPLCNCEILEHKNYKDVR